MKNIAINCGANAGFNKDFTDLAQEVGGWIVAQNYNLVYGGGKIGLMGTVAETVLAGGQKVIGIMPKFLAEREQSHSGLSKLILVDSMTERKNMMLKESDACLALPGGPGTLEEIGEAYSWLRIGASDNPVALLNFNHYFDSYLQQFDEMVTAGFLSESDRAKLFASDSLKEINDHMLSFKSSNQKEQINNIIS